MYEVTVESDFSSGHYLRNYRGKCENPHGHNYRLRITLQGPKLDSTGLLYDFVHLKQVIHTVMDGVDHKFLNDQAPFDTINPSAENMAKFFYDQVSRQLEEAPDGPRIRSITVWETDETSATYAP